MSLEHISDLWEKGHGYNFTCEMGDIISRWIVLETINYKLTQSPATSIM